MDPEQDAVEDPEDSGRGGESLLPPPLPARFGLSPLPLTALSFACGILISNLAAPLLFLPPLLFLGSLLTLLLSKRTPSFGLCLSLALFLLGATRNLLLQTPESNTLAALAPATVTVTGVVRSDIETTTSEDPKLPPRARCLFEVRRIEAVETVRRRMTASGSVWLTLPLGEANRGRLTLCRPLDLPQFGDLMTVHGRLEPPTGPRNPGGIDSSALLAQRAAVAQLRVLHLADWHVIRPNAEVQPIQAVAYALRQAMIRQMRRGLAREPAAVMEGLLLGARNDLPEALNDAFERTGAVHLLATAGLHVGLLVCLLLGVLRRLRLPRRPALLAVMALLPLYALMTGGRPAVIRAVVVAEIVLGGPLLEREPNLPNALSLAGLLLLLLNPHSLFEAGFQLTFATVITLLLLMPSLEAALLRLLPRRRGDLWRERGLRPLLTALSVAIVAQIGSLPLVAFHYHTLSLIAPFANALIVPFAGLLLTLGGLDIALGGLNPLLAWPVDRLLNALTTLLIAVVRACATPTWACLSVVAPPFSCVCLFYALLWSVVWYRERRAADRNARIQGRGGASEREMLQTLWRVPAVLATTALLAGLWNAVATRGDGRLHLWVLDVGQGNAAVLRTPGGRTFVIDAGSAEAPIGEDSGRRTIAPFLRSQGLGRVDGLILTSPQGEQSGGAPVLLRRVEVGILLDTGQPASTRLQTEILQAARERNVPCKAAHGGEVLECDDGVVVRFLRAPDRAGLVLRVEYGRTALLLLGNADGKDEVELLRTEPLTPVDLVAVGRQGEAGTASVGLVGAVRPHFAVISAGAPNRMHAPDREAINRLQAVGARVLRTDQSGAIDCVSDGVRVQVRPTLSSSP